FREGLAGVLVQLGLGIEAFHLAGAADHEQPDDALGLGDMMRVAVRRQPLGWLLGAGDAVLEEQRAERQAGKAHAGVSQKRTAADARAAGMSLLRHGIVSAISESSENRCDSSARAPGSREPAGAAGVMAAPEPPRRRRTVSACRRRSML